MLSARPVNNFSDMSMDSGATSRMAPSMSLKTPARPASNPFGFNTILRTNLKENTVNRAALLKTAPRTNFVPNTPGLKPNRRGFGALSLTISKDKHILGSEMKNTTKMPRLLDLTNKTPFANHIPESPVDHGGLSPIKAPFQLTACPSDQSHSPETVLRPSRARTSLRAPRVSDGSAHPLIPCTPDPSAQRKPWEAPALVDVSLEVENESPEVSLKPELDMDADIEYMPPKVADLPYDPGFEMPDYKELGAEIWKLGTVIDFRTLDGHRPREKPVVLLPEDHIYLDLPSVVTPTDYDEDLSTYTSSKDLYRSNGDIKHSTSYTLTTVPSTSPKQTARTITRPMVRKTLSKTTSSTTPGSSRPIQPSRKIPMGAGHGRAPSRSTIISSAATTRPHLEAVSKVSINVGRKTGTSSLAASSRAPVPITVRAKPSPPSRHSGEVVQSKPGANARRVPTTAKLITIAEMDKENVLVEDLMAPIDLLGGDFELSLLPVDSRDGF